MRLPVMLLCATAFSAAVPAYAADALKFGPPPPWVVPQPVPTNVKQTDAPTIVLLSDEQIALDPGKLTIYQDQAVKIQNPQGLDAGNLSLVWDPATETITVNKLRILRGGKTIDVLAAGQTFTTLRRETNLDAATLDGTLTATIQPEGLQEGDILELATTTERSDPVLKGHVETSFADWNDTHIEAAHSILSWPTTMKIAFKQWPSLPAGRSTTRDGRTVLELTGHDLDPVVPPSGAPFRFQVGRLAEATDFNSWDQVSELMLPLYRKAAVLPGSGPLHDEVEKIRSASKDPKIQAALALALVEDHVRYVALEMGQGGYVPAPAELTWSRRFGDCKGKSVLLLAILQSLGINAEPVLVNVGGGDVIADDLPMLDFNHVIVRAHIGGKSYWLDGTREADTSLDEIPVPDFGWVLPLTAKASLIHLIPPPPEKPDGETQLNVDASAGIYAPAPATGETVIRGDAAVAFEESFSGLSTAQQQVFLQKYWNKAFSFVTYKSGIYSYDKAKHELKLEMTGDAKLDWTGGFFHIPETTVGYNPDFDRPPGPLHDAPFAIAYPNYYKATASLRLPDSMVTGRSFGNSGFHQTLAGVEYSLTPKISGDTITVETSSRSVVPEISYSEAIAAKPKLKTISEQDIELPLPRTYRPTEKDLAALAEDTPVSADAYVDRGNTFLDNGKYDQAAADFSEALKLNPNEKWALADRGLAYVWTRRFEDADKDLTAAAAQDPDNAVVFRARGLMAEFKGDCEKAIDFYTQSLTKEAQNRFALARRAKCEADLLKDDSALSDSSEVLEAAPSAVDMRLLRANIFLREGKRNAVAAEAEALMRDNPKSEFALIAAAKSYAAIGQYDKAMQLFEKQLAIKPTALIYINRSQVRPRSDAVGKMKDLDEALKLEADNVDALALKAALLSKQSKYAEALALYDRVPKSTANELWVKTQRAILLDQAGQKADAEKAFADLSSKAKSAGELNNLCWAEGTAGVMLDSAVQECREAVKLSNGVPQYVDSLGMALLKSGKLDEALAAYNESIEKGHLAASYMGRAIIYARKGESAHAQADFVEAKKLDPTIEDRFLDYGLTFDELPKDVKTAAGKTEANSAPANATLVKKITVVSVTPE